MKTAVKTYFSSVKKSSLTSNVQRVLFSLLSALDRGDGWVSVQDLGVPSAPSRVRDLRKEAYGSFDVQCKSAAELGRVGDQYTYFYKLTQRNLTQSKLRRIFE